MWKRILAWNRDSATHLVANLTIAASAAFEAAVETAAFIDDDLRAQIVALIPTRWVPLGTIGLMIVVKLARNRSMRKAA